MTEEMPHFLYALGFKLNGLKTQVQMDPRIRITSTYMTETIE